MQEQLLRKADSEGWTARQLKIAVDEIAGRQPRTGRPKTSGVSKTLKLLAQPDRAFEGIDSLLALDKNAAAELLAICRKAQDCIKRAERALEHATLGHSRLGVLLVDPDRTFALRAQRQLRGQASMIRIVASAAEAKEALAGDTACAIINVSLPDCSAVALANTLRQLRPSIRIIFLTSRAGRALPASLRELEPLVEKTTGLHLLKIALAKALAEKSPNIDPGC
jgi:CheY-like chemotaxis protein